MTLPLKNCRSGARKAKLWEELPEQSPQSQIFGRVAGAEPAKPNFRKSCRSRARKAKFSEELPEQSPPEDLNLRAITYDPLIIRSSDQLTSELVIITTVNSPVIAAAVNLTSPVTSASEAQFSDSTEIIVTREQRGSILVQTVLSMA